MVVVVALSVTVVVVETVAVGCRPPARATPARRQTPDARRQPHGSDRRRVRHPHRPSLTMAASRAPTVNRLLSTSASPHRTLPALGSSMRRRLPRLIATTNRSRPSRRSKASKPPLASQGPPLALDQCGMLPPQARQFLDRPMQVVRRRIGIPRETRCAIQGRFRPRGRPRRRNRSPERPGR